MRSVVWVAICSAVLVMVCGVRAWAADPSRGRELAERFCGRCHAVSLSGASPQRGIIAFRDLKSRYPIDMLRQALKSGIIEGHDEMPMFELGRPAVEDLIAYIDRLAGEGPVYLRPR